MIITRTPYRVSLFGGGTDHPKWYLNNDGAVLSFAIDKYSYINVRELPPFFEHDFRLSYSKVETAKNLESLKHNAIREGFRKFAPNLKFELHHHGDLPARSGVGSSSAFVVGLINSLSALTNTKFSTNEIATLAIQFEQNILKENVGSQDQIATAFGGINFIEFKSGQSWSIEHLDLSSNYQQEIETRSVLVYSGIQRSSSDISATLLENLASKTILMNRTRDLAYECKDILMGEKNLSLIGPLLRESWEIKNSLNPKASTPELETLFKQALDFGAEGGKVLGAGGGGFCLFWVSPGHRETFIKLMEPRVVVPIKISHNGTSRIL